LQPPDPDAGQGDLAEWGNSRLYKIAHPPIFWCRQARKQARVPALPSKVTSWIANDAGHNQSVDVSYFAQTPDGQRRNRDTNRYAIAKRSVFISTC
jgi:hypothetical protein